MGDVDSFQSSGCTRSTDHISCLIPHFQNLWEGCCHSRFEPKCFTSIAWIHLWIPWILRPSIIQGPIQMCWQCLAQRCKNPWRGHTILCRWVLRCKFRPSNFTTLHSIVHISGWSLDLQGSHFMLVYLQGHINCLNPFEVLQSGISTGMLWYNFMMNFLYEGGTILG